MGVSSSDIASSYSIFCDNPSTTHDDHQLIQNEQQQTYHANTNNYNNNNNKNKNNNTGLN